MMRGRRLVASAVTPPVLGVAAAVAQKVFSALSVLVLLFVYVRLLPPEAYGLFALYVSLQMILTVFDLGISTAASREFALPMSASRVANLLRAFETYIFAAAGALLVTGVALSGFIGEAEVEERADLRLATYLVVACLAAELPSKLYIGVLLGRRRQAHSARLLFVLDCLRWWGGVGVAAVTGDLVVLFAWQLGVVVVWSIVLRRHVWRTYEPGLELRGQARFTSEDLTRLGRVVLAPMAFATLAGGVRLYADRLYAGVTLDLVSLGGYTTGFAIAGGLALLSTQVSAILIPTFAHFSEADGSVHGMRAFLTTNVAVAVCTTLVAIGALLVMDPVAQALGLADQGRRVFTAVFPIAVVASTLAALTGPSYAVSVAQRRYGFVAAVNTVGALLVAGLLATGPTSPAQLACVAVLGAGVVLGAFAVSLWNRCGGPMTAGSVVLAHALSFPWLAAATVVLVQTAASP